MDELENLPGVGPATAEKLSDSGFDTLESVATATSHELTGAANIGTQTATKIIRSAREAADMGYEKATEVMERRKLVGTISTGSDALDEMLAGGVETQAITEVFGEFGTGKTQLAHQLSVNVQLPLEKGGLEGRVIYIDTENTFRPERISQMAEAVDLDPQEVLENIYVARACTTDHQMLLAEKASDMAEDDGVKLLVVDALMSIFRTEYVGRGALAERQQKLGRHLATLHELSERHNLAVLVTNHVMSNPGTFFGDPTKPIGGHVLGHAATGRIYIRKSKKNTRKAKLVDHPGLPPKKVKFQIANEGIRD
ncbi:DNA repair and recombination protein RadA [candidate division MSBL1 archaeon SCGC-AAA261O19]|uniref:DNA repair and recombination protein RadA n=2 Tax=candidate division MSBL1 TaxID=215777 RepID=A0A133V2K8_9EURY|nr:DNA repair and recombination protein RadA [candidate division MSBL1 archaeon SCGC-AAA261C02]KXB05007.1 DNA repair and recombination protein RadA [candidate division MSBL1 archaeon SCGC-AAA261O19]